MNAADKNPRVIQFDDDRLMPPLPPDGPDPADPRPQSIGWQAGAVLAWIFIFCIALLLLAGTAKAIWWLFRL